MENADESMPALKRHGPTPQKQKHRAMKKQTKKRGSIARRPNAARTSHPRNDIRGGMSSPQTNKIGRRLRTASQKPNNPPQPRKHLIAPETGKAPPTLTHFPEGEKRQRPSLGEDDTGSKSIDNGKSRSESPPPSPPEVEVTITTLRDEWPGAAASPSQNAPLTSRMGRYKGENTSRARSR